MHTCIKSRPWETPTPNCTHLHLNSQNPKGLPRTCIFHKNRSLCMLHGARLSTIDNTSHSDWAWPYPIDRIQLVKPSDQALWRYNEINVTSDPPQERHRGSVNDHNLTSWWGPKELGQTFSRSAQATYGYLQAKDLYHFPRRKNKSSCLGLPYPHDNCCKTLPAHTKVQVTKITDRWKAIDKGGRSKTCDPCADGNN